MAKKILVKGNKDPKPEILIMDCPICDASLHSKMKMWSMCTLKATWWVQWWTVRIVTHFAVNFTTTWKCISKKIGNSNDRLRHQTHKLLRPCIPRQRPETRGIGDHRIRYQVGERIIADNLDEL